jgi:hypothetical protein
MEILVAEKKIQPCRNQKPFLKGSNLTQKEFCGHR